MNRSNFTLKTFSDVPPPFYLGLELGNGNVFAHGLELISATVLDVYTSILKKAMLVGKTKKSQNATAVVP